MLIGLVYVEMSQADMLLNAGDVGGSSIVCRWIVGQIEGEHCYTEVQALQWHHTNWNWEV